MNNLWGIDLGGTKVEGAVLKSALDPEVLYRDRLPTESEKGMIILSVKLKKWLTKWRPPWGTKHKRLVLRLLEL
ncbi:MAG: hypothetical protein U5K54_24190 [Cytophagales bacterium]|nr:hypothetical protein [Cytophagales bacterium]